MPSTFAWLDYSDFERRKMLEVVQLFAEQTTRDELGLGSVWDAFSEMLFPGTSTIQTRARYFFFIPWIYLSLERKRIPSAKFAADARRAEVALIRPLVESGDPDGAIGRVAKENLQRLPSSVYWQGLTSLGFRWFHGSQGDYFRSLDRFYREPARQFRNDDGEPHDAQSRANWHANLPTPPSEFPKQATFALRRVEAEFFRERVLTRHGKTLFAWLLRERRPVASFDFAWEIPEPLPVLLCEQLHHARRFSEAMYGAMLLYNLLLTEKKGWSELADVYREDLAEWSRTQAHDRSAWLAWDRRTFWQIVQAKNPRVGIRTQRFVDAWLQLVLQSATVKEAVTSDAARHLVHERERQLKGARARLDSPRALELWTGASGVARLDFRWSRTKRIIGDVLVGLEADDA